MKIINKNKVESFLERMNFKETIFVLDFDWTITTTWDWGSFSPINRGKNAPIDFMKALGEYYYPIEKASKFSEIKDSLEGLDFILADSWISFEDFRHIMMSRRWNTTMMIAVKYHLDIDNFSVEEWEFREWMEWFLHYLSDNSRDYLIVSAWIKNYIKNFFIHHWFRIDRMHIVGNEFMTDNQWKAIGYDKNLITPFTKQHLDYREHNIWKKQFAIQFWDSLWDARIINDHFEGKNVLSIWITSWDESRYESFCELFDIVLETKEEGINEVLKLLKIKI